jgi:hypothetical protein
MQFLPRSSRAIAPQRISADWRRVGTCDTLVSRWIDRRREAESVDATILEMPPHVTRDQAIAYLRRTATEEAEHGDHIYALLYVLHENGAISFEQLYWILSGRDL